MGEKQLRKVGSDGRGVFDGLRHSDDEANEYWSARELQGALGYSSWQKFKSLITKAKVSFGTSEAGGYYDIDDHFSQVVKMVPTGSGAERAVEDYMLSRYACYLIAQNGDPSKKPIALAQAYFNIQTFRQEMNVQMAKDRARLDRRQEFSESDKRLSENIMEMGVSARGMVEIKDSGNRVFFGGNGAKEMSEKLGAGDKPWANRASNVILAGKTLANELTSSSIEYRGVGVGGADEIREVNDDNNQAVRETIHNQQGLYPEDFPPAEDTERIKRRMRQEERKRLG